MAIARRETVVLGEEGTYHCVTHCVRHALLCGSDDRTGKRYDHRQVWVRDRLRSLARHFAVDVLGYAVLKDRVHLILRARPDLARTWSDRNLARRWLCLFPKRFNLAGENLRPRPAAIAKLLAEADRLSICRERLASISWFMRCLNEFIARKANREEGCRGRFWEGRFHCRALLDHAAILTCMAYVDLAPLRAGQTRGSGRPAFTAAHERSTALRSRQTARRLRQEKGSPGQPEASTRLLRAARDSRKDQWLAPLEDRPSRARRGALAMEVEEYLRLLKWSSALIADDAAQTARLNMAVVLRRLGLSPALWQQALTDFEAWFVRVAGQPQAILAAARRMGRRFLKGVGPSQRLFLPPGACLA